MAGQPEFDTPRTIRLLQDWIDADKKATPLKTLQGLIWDDGFKRGELVGDVYPDVPPALRRWHDAGIRLYVYSSGSVQAQRLVFGYTRFGDLTPLFSGYFDTRVGPKLEQASYRVIAAAIDTTPGEILFLSDHTGELDAAQAAGLRTTALDRGEAVLPERHPHLVAKTFDDVERLALAPGLIDRPNRQSHRRPCRRDAARLPPSLRAHIRGHARIFSKTRQRWNV